MKVLLIFVGCLVLLAVTEANPSAARYDDFKVYRIYISHDQQLSELKNMADNLPLRMLNEPRGRGHSNDIIIDPANQRKLENKLRYLDIDFECIIEDLQSAIEEEQGHSNGAYDDVQPTLFNDRSSLEVPQTEMNWTSYQSLNTIYKWLDELAEQYPDLVTLFNIGLSYEKRPIRAIKISSKADNKAIFMESNIHAIEWISSATTTYLIKQLTSSQNKEIRLLVENYDWILVPVLNPDGFEYTHNVERLWRKNRKPTGYSNSSGPCYGVDLNRNFGYKWGVNAYNYDVPCDHWYAGAESETEPEVLALQNFVRSQNPNYIKMYMAVHSFGDMVLLPYGHTDKEFPPNYDQMMGIATAFADAAEEIYGTHFRCGASSIVNYNVSGSAKDWAYGEMGIPFTATIELRDTGKYGFFLPPSQILEVGIEFIHGLVAMVKKAKKSYIFV